MKKTQHIIITTLVLTFIIPHTALASWWNPFSWNIFKRQDQKTLQLENKVKELEERLNKNTETTTTNTSPVKQPVTPKNTVNKDVKIVETVKPIAPVKTLAQPVATTKQITKKDLESLLSTVGSRLNKLSQINEDVNLLKDTPKITQVSKDSIYALSREILGTVTDGSNDKTNYNNLISKSTSDTELRTYYGFLTDLVASLDSKITDFQSKQYSLKNSIALQTGVEELDSLKAQTAQAREKQAKLDAINLEIAKLNAKRVKDIDALKSVYGSKEGKNATLSSIEEDYTQEYNRLMAEFQLIKYSK